MPLPTPLECSGVLVGSCAVFCGGLGAGCAAARNVGIIEFLLLPRMTSTDRNDLMPAQEKLEWVTPKISLMEAGDTAGSGKNKSNKEITFIITVGPS